MNAPERQAWETLIGLGAKVTEIGGKIALDLRPSRITSRRKVALFCMGILEAAGRSGANRRHVDRNGYPVFIVTDDKELSR